MNNILIGSVGSSRIVLEEMLKTGFPLSLVLSLDEDKSDNVSGYVPIHEIAKEHGIPYSTFRKVNDKEVVEQIKNLNPDYIFVIGLSQIIPKYIIDMAQKGVVGFHPTPLPKFRGRAAMVWQILLGVHETKCTLFFIDEGMDSGDILGQEEYVIDENDYAIDVQKKLHIALRKLTNRVLNQILDGSIQPKKQNEAEATYLLVRRPEDGHIDWNKSADEIHRLIRAVSKPYPGAFGLYDGEHKIIIWRAEKHTNTKYYGLPGQIAEIKNGYIDVLCSDGIIRIQEFDNKDNIMLRVGHKLK